MRISDWSSDVCSSDLANLKTQLKSYMEMVSQPIEIVACLDDGAKSRELRELLQEIEGMSDKISLTERNDSDERKPSFTINRSEIGRASCRERVCQYV